MDDLGVPLFLETPKYGIEVRKSFLSPWSFGDKSEQCKKGRWLFRGFVGDEILPSYVGIIRNHYKDP